MLLGLTYFYLAFVSAFTSLPQNLRLELFRPA